jgi:hypothetical protein
MVLLSQLKVLRILREAEGKLSLETNYHGTNGSNKISNAGNILMVHFLSLSEK